MDFANWYVSDQSVPMHPRSHEIQDEASGGEPTCTISRVSGSIATAYVVPCKEKRILLTVRSKSSEGERTSIATSGLSCQKQARSVSASIRLWPIQDASGDLTAPR